MAGEAIEKVKEDIEKLIPEQNLGILYVAFWQEWAAAAKRGAERCSLWQTYNQVSAIQQFDDAFSVLADVAFVGKDYHSRKENFDNARGVLALEFYGELEKIFQEKCECRFKGK